jgi:uncharacterized membrane protein
MVVFVVVYCFLLGSLTGLRSMSGPALVCWGIHLGWLTVAGSPLFFLGQPISLVVFSLLAVGELIGDKLPQIPNRIDPGPLVARIVFGGMSGWVLASSGHVSIVAGVVCAAAGAVAGAFAGFHIRRAITRRGVKDLPVAIVEDLIAVGGGLFLISRHLT